MVSSVTPKQTSTMGYAARYSKTDATRELHVHGVNEGFYITPHKLLTSNGLHGVVPQEIELFLTTAVRTSNTSMNAFILHHHLVFLSF
jgi:hypothetical protein